MKRFIKVKNGKIIDTMLLLPHTECYYKENDKLYVEQIDGSIYYLGTIVKESDKIEDIIS